MAHDPQYLLPITAQIVVAALPFTQRDRSIPDLIASTYAALKATDESQAEQPVATADSAPHIPAVTERKSLANPEHILSMIDGKPYKTLRRHLATHGLTPDEYRERYGLKASYPMVAPTYSAARSKMAKDSGLGTKKGDDRGVA